MKNTNYNDLDNQYLKNQKLLHNEINISSWKNFVFISNSESIFVYKIDAIIEMTELNMELKNDKIEKSKKISPENIRKLLQR